MTAFLALINARTNAYSGPRQKAGYFIYGKDFLKIKITQLKTN